MVRQGQASDIVSTIVFLVGFTIVVVVGLKVYQDFNNKYDMGPDAQSTFDDAIKIFNSWDAAGVFIIGGLVVSLVISAVFVKTHPVFMVVNIVLLGVSLLVVPMLSNMLTEVMDSDNLNEASVNFPILAYARDNYPTIAVVAGMIFFVALYAKSRGGQSQYGV